MLTRDTSLEAARSMRAYGFNAVQNRILRLMRDTYRLNGGRGLTCDEMEVRLAIRHQTVSSQIRFLYLKGLIDATRERRKTRSGRNAVVWVANPERDTLSARGLASIRVGTSVRGSHS